MARSTSGIRCCGFCRLIKKVEADLPVVVAFDAATSYLTVAEDAEDLLVCSLLAVPLNLGAST